MCCFSSTVREVSDTNIFARAAEGGRQFIVYSMRVSAPTERQSDADVRDFVPKPSRARGVLDAAAPCYRLILEGSFRNEDVMIAA